MLECGQILNNGATVLEMKGTGMLVLAFRAGTALPFVIWDINTDGDCYTGRYFKTNVEACKAWEKV